LGLNRLTPISDNRSVYEAEHMTTDNINRKHSTCIIRQYNKNLFIQYIKHIYVYTLQLIHQINDSKFTRIVKEQKYKIEKLANNT